MEERMFSVLKRLYVHLILYPAFRSPSIEHLELEHLVLRVTQRL